MFPSPLEHPRPYAVGGEEVLSFRVSDSMPMRPWIPSLDAIVCMFAVKAPSTVPRMILCPHVSSGESHGPGSHTAMLQKMSGSNGRMRAAGLPLSNHSSGIARLVLWIAIHTATMSSAFQCVSRLLTSNMAAACTDKPGAKGSAASTAAAHGAGAGRRPPRGAGLAGGLDPVLTVRPGPNGGGVDVGVRRLVDLFAVRQKIG